ncbi:Threonine dehydrogenase [Rhodopirellula islandica]|uniref:Threonine dehydrogenase n=1 Tax=Rhodopirellula islandica TaxID=595434 RepID=A0A0J1B802_RHOIS|nr:Threonine dehydrogenase [Rhodopirellula islandica]
MGHSPAGLFGYTHMLGGYAGGQAEYLRVPYADVGPIKVPDGLPDEQVVFLSDIFPTGYMAAENCDIQSTDTVAVWGCPPTFSGLPPRASEVGPVRGEVLRMALEGASGNWDGAIELMADVNVNPKIEFFRVPGHFSGIAPLVLIG